MASNVRFLDQVSVGTFQSVGSIDTGSFLITASTAVGTAGIVFTKGNGDTFTVDVVANIFPYTGSAIITGSLDLIGPLVITGSINESPFIIHLEDGNGPDDKLKVNQEGILVLSPLDFTPTPVSGGIYYSVNNEFFLGFA